MDTDKQNEEKGILMACGGWNGFDACWDNRIPIFPNDLNYTGKMRNSNYLWDNRILLVPEDLNFSGNPIIDIGTAVVGGGLGLIGKGKELKAQKYASQAEIIRALSEQKKEEIKAKSKKNILFGIIGIVIILGTIALLIVYQKRKKEL